MEWHAEVASINKFSGSELFDRVRLFSVTKKRHFFDSCGGSSVAQQLAATVALCLVFSSSALFR